MTEVIGIRFRSVGKLYYFDPAGYDIKKNDKVIVETARGIECGTAVTDVHDVEDASIVKPLKSVTRKATPADIKQYENNLAKEKEAFSVCQRKIAERKLEMKLVDVEYTFDGQKILFYFTADGRVDFRDLVKDLAGVFRTRIELRQIGVRDESKLLGGIGICGQPFCCSTFLFDFQPVSIKMAKEQGKSLNPTKISGTCGRLMCCLKYEQNVYDEMIKLIPRNGTIVKTADGEGSVIEANVLKGQVRVRLFDNNDAAPKMYPVGDITVIGRKPQQGRQQRAPKDDDSSDNSD
ncbi:MAG: stage 0 sporulation family protein [Oscillospiraceae bacterium]|nr:stage 0 sporulation family protein [Oscillospiraceae bacterium]